MTSLNMPIYKATFCIKKSTMFFRARDVKEAVKKAQDHVYNFNKDLNGTKKALGIERELLNLVLCLDKPKVNL